MDQIKEKNKPRITPEEEKEIIKAYKLGATDLEVHFETGIDLEDIIYWRSYGDNNSKINHFLDFPIWEAKKIYYKPKTHKEAGDLLKSHPRSKAEFSERLVHVGEKKNPIRIENINIIEPTHSENRLTDEIPSIIDN